MTLARATEKKTWTYITDISGNREKCAILAAVLYVFLWNCGSVRAILQRMYTIWLWIIFICCFRGPLKMHVNGIEQANGQAIAAHAGLLSFSVSLRGRIFIPFENISMNTWKGSSDCGAYRIRFYCWWIFIPFENILFLSTGALQLENDGNNPIDMMLDHASFWRTI